MVHGCVQQSTKGAPVKRKAGDQVIKAVFGEVTVLGGAVVGREVMAHHGGKLYQLGEMMTGKKEM